MYIAFLNLNSLLNEFATLSRFASKKFATWFSQIFKFRFRQKYHPEDSKFQKEQHRGFVNRRLEVFREFLANELVKNINLDYNNAVAIIRFLDSGIYIIPFVIDKR